MAIKGWVYNPRRQSKPKVSDSLKQAVKTKAGELVETVLMPQYLKPPPEDLEIKIRPLLSRGNIRKKLESLYKSNRDVNPFETIQDIGKWQQEIRDEWQ